MFKRKDFVKERLTTMLVFLLMGAQLAGAASPAPNGKHERATTYHARLLRPLPPPRLTLLDETLQLSLHNQEVFTAGPEVAPPPATAAEERSWKIKPYLGVKPTEQGIAPPERPAISVIDPLTTPPSQIVAGFTYSRDNRFFLNFGYGLPTTPLREYTQPYGLQLFDEEDSKRISIGIDISF